MGSVQSACCVHLQLQTVGGQEVLTLFEEPACVQHSQLAGSSSDMCEHSASDRGGQEVPTLFEESVRQSACVSSGCGGQEVPTLFEDSARVQCSQPACVYLQLQTVGVRKSRPFLKNQRDSQFACRQTVGVRKSRPFLKNQHAFNTVSLQVPLQPQTVRVTKSDPCLKDRLDSQFAGLQTHVQHSQFANVPLQRLN